MRSRWEIQRGGKMQRSVCAEPHGDPSPLFIGSHYPNPPELPDYLDEIGMLFWEEIPMWGYETAALMDPLTCQRGLVMHEEMIRRDYHHPAIIFWGLHNEISTDTDAGYQITKWFYAL